MPIQGTFNAPISSKLANYGQLQQGAPRDHVHPTPLSVRIEDLDAVIGRLDMSVLQLFRVLQKVTGSGQPPQPPENPKETKLEAAPPSLHEAVDRRRQRLVEVADDLERIGQALVENI